MLFKVSVVFVELLGVVIVDFAVAECARVLLEQDGLDLPGLEGLERLVGDERGDPFHNRGPAVMVLFRLQHEVRVLVEEVAIWIRWRLSCHCSPDLVGTLWVVEGLYVNGVSCTLLHGDRQLR